MSFTTSGPALPDDGTPVVSRWRDVYLAAGARAVSSCGDFLAATSLALALQSAGAGGLAVSGVMLAATLPLVLLAPLTGRLADRMDSRTLLVWAGAGQAVVCAALAFAGNTVLILLLAALLACGLAVTQPTLAALLPEMVRRDDLPRASAINLTAGSVGILVAPALAGLLVGQFGARIPLLLDAGSYLALIAAGLLLRTRRGGRRPTGAAGGASPAPTAPAWRLRRDPLLWAMVAAIAATVAGVGAVNVIEVFYVRETLHSSTAMFGLVSAAWTAGMLVGAWLLAGTARRARDDGARVTGVLGMLGAACLLVGLGATVPAAGWLVPLWLVGGVANGGLNVFSNLVLANRVPPEARGRAFAAQGAAIQGAGMFGYLAGGILLAGFPPRPLVAVAGLAGLAVVAAVAPVVLRAARLERATMRPGPLPPRSAERPVEPAATVGS
ncbi:MFS transporter [Plantactinospora sp. KLBMP9567]|uniref:MFS transporter n=1 Tax=Plantactinospora sp. KLBMP9567 TaxID=3085900 RepID=UPI0029814F68|nr:MFS transporter [Plantactinospora sp. KLBMP9567]MDW5329126.1 MFS transporter [Plantactinospora sp. KLBMP9567]MDW5329970.1 MFS transporter [Plantactinospora sp. KLBMP9567]